MMGVDIKAAWMLCIHQEQGLYGSQAVNAWACKTTVLHSVLCANSIWKSVVILSILGLQNPCLLWVYTVHAHFAFHTEELPSLKSPCPDPSLGTVSAS